METIIQKTTGGNLVIKGSNLFLQSASGEDFFKGDSRWFSNTLLLTTQSLKPTGIGVSIW